MNETNLIHITVAAVGITLSIVIEHLLVGKRWKRYEYARRAMGIVTVFVWLGFLAVHGIVDTHTVEISFVAFGLAGATLGIMATAEKTKTANQARAELGRNGTTGGPGTILPR